MKKTILILCFILLTVPFADAIPSHKYENMPQGTFKKQKNGTIVQYDKNGKKTGIYKLRNGKYVKVK